MNFWNNEEKSTTGDFDSKSGKSEDTSEVFLTDKHFTRNDILICASHGFIYAIHKGDGSRLWRAKFGGTMGGVVALFVTDNDKLIAGANGKTTCINLMNGQTIWINKMPGFGLEEVSILTTPSRYLQPQKHPSEARDTSEFPPQYNEHVIPDKPIVLGCSRGKAMAMDIETGETLWKYNCPGGWYNLPVALVEPPSLEEGRPNQLVYIGAGKWVYCLKARTGDVIWSVKVSDCTFGLNYMTLATPWSSRLAAESHSAFSQNPVAQARAMQRDSERSSS